jgi:hypothetical protein
MDLLIQKILYDDEIFEELRLRYKSHKRNIKIRSESYTQEQLILIAKEKRIRDALSTKN